MSIASGSLGWNFDGLCLSLDHAVEVNYLVLKHKLGVGVAPMFRGVESDHFLVSGDPHSDRDVDCLEHQI